MIIGKTLINWYLSNKRELPWRKTNDPYCIWLSEIMLQQTRIDQGLPYYLTFTKVFPSVFDLAKSSQEEVLKLWQGLGYYSRARNLHETAKYVAFECNGVFPDSYKELLKLKGVGDYTASAIASICFNEPVAVVDGNVFRVLARYFNIDTPINSPAGVKEFKFLAQEILEVDDPGTYNQAIMEFGARQCKPQQPLCDTCPLSGSCLALKNNNISSLPVKIKKVKVKKRYFNYLVLLSDENTTTLLKREGKGIWEGLYEFPMLETANHIEEENLMQLDGFKDIVGSKFRSVSLYNDSPIVHKLSHQHIYTKFWLVDKEKLIGSEIPIQELEEYPVPVLIANFINEYSFGY